ncbi:MAG: hypothetical protein C4289_09545, partial [Chloroflexota bacterium]
TPFALRESVWHGSMLVALPLRAETEHGRWLHELYRRAYGHDPLTEWREVLVKLYPRGGSPMACSSGSNSGQPAGGQP